MRFVRVQKSSQLVFVFRARAHLAKSTGSMMWECVQCKKSRFVLYCAGNEILRCGLRSVTRHEEKNRCYGEEKLIDGSLTALFMGECFGMSLNRKKIVSKWTLT